MSFNRRDFLATLAAAATGALLDPERLAWVPGKKSYFDIQPPALPVGWMSAKGAHLLIAGDIITIDGYFVPNSPGGELLQRFIVVNNPATDDGIVQLHPPIIAEKRVFTIDQPRPSRPFYAAITRGRARR